MHFYADESCGQCTPCREGTGWLHRLVKKLRRGEGTPEDLERIEHVCSGMIGHDHLPAVRRGRDALRSFLAKFRGEFEALVQDQTPVAAESRWPRGEQE